MRSDVWESSIDEEKEEARKKEKMKRGEKRAR